jgi:hypothetical protein
MHDTPARLELVSVVSIEVRNKKEMESGTMKCREVRSFSGVHFEVLPVRIRNQLFLLKNKGYHDSSLLPVLRTVDAARCNRYVAKVAKVAWEVTTNDHSHQILHWNPPLFFVTAVFCNTISEVPPNDGAYYSDDEPDAGSLHAPMFSGNGWNTTSVTSYLRKGNASFRTFLRVLLPT